MNKRQYVFLLLLSLLATTAAAPSNEEAHIKNTISKLFDGMRKSDTTLIRDAFGRDAIMQTISQNKQGNTILKSVDLNSFIASIAKPHPEIFDERIVFTKILIDENLASVWTDYKFYIGENFSHCGVNSFQLVKTEKDWKIAYLIDTRRKENCN